MLCWLSNFLFFTGWPGCPNWSVQGKVVRGSAAGLVVRQHQCTALECHTSSTQPTLLKELLSRDLDQVICLKPTLVSGLSYQPLPNPFQPISDEIQSGHFTAVHSWRRVCMSVVVWAQGSQLRRALHCTTLFEALASKDAAALNLAKAGPPTCPDTGTQTLGTEAA